MPQRLHQWSGGKVAFGPNWPFLVLINALFMRVYGLGRNPRIIAKRKEGALVVGYRSAGCCLKLFEIFDI